MAHTWAYAALIVLAVAAAGTGFAYYYGYGQPAAQASIPLRIQVEGLARGGSVNLQGITVSIDYSGSAGRVLHSSVTDMFGMATFYVPANTAVTVSDSLTGYKTVQVGASALTVTLYHVSYSS